MKYKDIRDSFTSITGKTVRTITPIENGITNYNYLINNAYVYREVNPNRDESLSFKKEHEVYKALEDTSFTEKVIYYSEEDGTKISRFIHSSRSYVNTPSREQIFLVAKLIKKFQRTGLKVDFEYDAFKKLELYKSVLPQGNKKDDEEDYQEELNIVPSNYEKKILSEYEKVSKLYPQVLSHNDLVRNNVLFTFNKVYFIDWEYASMNNSLFDVASFISENNLNDEQAEYFLKTIYGAKLNKLLVKRINIVIRFQDILFFYWALYCFKKEHKQVYRDIADEKFSRIKSTGFTL